MITGSYALFLFSGGFWNWLLRDAVNAFIAASAFAAGLVLPTLLCIAGGKLPRVGLVGVWLGVACCVGICGIYGWRAYLAYFEQDNPGKTALIGLGILAGLIAIGLLLVNRDHGRRSA